MVAIQEKTVSLHEICHDSVALHFPQRLAVAVWISDFNFLSEIPSKKKWPFIFGVLSSRNGKSLKDLIWFFRNKWDHLQNLTNLMIYFAGKNPWVERACLLVKNKNVFVYESSARFIFWPFFIPDNTGFKLSAREDFQCRKLATWQPRLRK